LAKHADGTAIQMLDLGDVVEERLGSGFWIHGQKYMCMPYITATKKGRKTQFEEFCLPPVRALNAKSKSFAPKHKTQFA
jgi:hypothetical protein